MAKTKARKTRDAAAKRRAAREKSTCLTGKIQYNSETRANQALLTAWRRGVTNLERSYQCPDCGQWHLTSVPQR